MKREHSSIILKLIILISVTLLAVCGYASETDGVVTLPNSLVTIEDGAFMYDASIKTVIMPDGVEVIGYNAFSGCTSLESVIIPESVREIGEYAFENCTGLKEVTILGKATAIGESAFSGCLSLTINCESGSQALGYAIYNGIAFSVPQTSVLPESDHPYADNAYVAWKYTHPSAADYLRVTFSDNTMFEYEYDYIYVYDDVLEIYEQYTGDHLMGETIIVPSPEFYIAFFSDYDTTEYGFKVTQVEGCMFEPLKLNSLTSNIDACQPGETIIWSADVQDGRFPLSYSWYVMKDGIKVHEFADEYTYIYYTPRSVGEYTASVVITDKYGETYEMNSAPVLVSLDGITPESEFTYELDYSAFDEYAVITGYTGNAAEIAIPAQIDGYTAKAIGENAFSKNTTLKKVVLPHTIFDVYANAFSGCTSLESFEAINQKTSFNKNVFNGCDLLTIHCASGSEALAYALRYGIAHEVDVPEIFEQSAHFSTDTVNGARKYVLDSLDYVSLSITDIDNIDAFNLITIYDGFGNKCVEFKGNDIVSTTPMLYGGAFYIACAENWFENCSFNITALSSGNYSPLTGASVTSDTDEYWPGNTATWLIETENGYYPLTCDWKLYKGSEMIYEYTGSVTTLEYILSEANEYTMRVTVTDQTGASIEAYSTVSVGISEPTPATDFIYNQLDDTYCEIINYTGSAKNVIIPEQLNEFIVKSISEQAFFDNYNLNNVCLPDTITSIGASAFEYCINLKQIIIPESVEFIGEYAFYSCLDLRTIEISRTDVVIDYNPFGNCPLLTLKCPNGSSALAYAIDWSVDTTVTGDTGALPRLTGDYADEVYIAWKYVHPSAADYLRITFSDDTLTEYESDYITVYYGSGEQYRTYSSGELAGNTIELDGNCFYIRLEASSIKEGYGFEIVSVESVARTSP